MREYVCAKSDIGAPLSRRPRPLVTKLRLVMPVRETPFRGAWQRDGIQARRLRTNRETEFRGWGSQTEFGNQVANSLNGAQWEGGNQNTPKTPGFFLQRAISRCGAL